MTKQGFTAIAVVVDESGSMSPLHDDTIGGFNTFLKEQKELPGEAILSLVKFNTTVTKVHDCALLKDVKPLTKEDYIPLGGTSLFDALCVTINSLGNKLSAMKEEERPSRVVVLVITDGQENSSREFSASQVKELVQEQQSKYNWEFVFIGANIDAFAAGTSLGFSGKQTAQYTASSAGTHKLYANVSRGVAAVRNRTVKYGDSILGSESLEVKEESSTTTTK